MDDSRYVAVTGIGMISSLGLSTPECWKNMVDGKPGVRRITRFDTSDCLTKIGGELPLEYYEVEKKEFSKRFFKQTASTARLGLLCAKEAIKDSGLEIEKLDPYRCPVISGSGGFILEEGKGLEELKTSKFGVLQEMVNAISAWISIKYSLKGPSFNVATACGSGGFAIWNAFDYVRSGKADMAVAVGLDMMVTKESIQSFNQLMALSEENNFPERASRPFDKRRSGFVLANGGCAVILERLDHARQRDANIYALASGYGCSSEAFNIVAPDPTGKEMAKTMSLALEDARISKEKIGYVNAHGTSTPHNDRCETRAIKTVFGEHAYKLAVSSQKSMIGHTIGGAGAIEFGVTALSLHHGIITPTINYEEPDPDCDLDYVPNEAREVNDLEAAISNSFGFGGHNCSIVLEKYK
ncbi:beta-ketoacyl-[acyl-carrier-protein] synthase family protein [bacterium]|nr:beta-ketoacyl-[acyl-carrier-protein] synthase family protein [bacterium]MBU1614331.1 beta-ketoacyl-[acyl-carrier-protein] synthase family protein [bacterium]